MNKTVNMKVNNLEDNHELKNLLGNNGPNNSGKAFKFFI